jgi:uncharacterized protein
MNMTTRAWLLAAACTLAGTAAAQPTAPPGNAPPTVAAPSVRAGIDAWAAGNWPLAIANFRPLADRGDADAQYAIAQAYFLGRGVPQNSNLAEQWYERAARQGHEEAQANYGLLLFQNGRRREAMPWIERAAGRGDPRAQYVLGTALFNGDLVGVDLPRAYALMSRAADAGLPPAINQLQAMQPHLSAEDRARGAQIARTLPRAPQPEQMAAATPAYPTAAPPPPLPQRIVRTPPVRIAERPPAPAPVAAAGGRWRIQLGAFSSEANARRAWSAAAGRLSGLQPYYVRAGAVIRVQAGPLRDRAAAARACAAVGSGCFPVAP